MSEYDPDDSTEPDSESLLRWQEGAPTFLRGAIAGAFAALEMDSGAERSFTGTERFTIRRKIGQGGFGVVFEAYDEWERTEVALKTLRHSEILDGGLKREFRVLAGLDHPNLVSLYELFSDQSRSFFTMELIGGSSFTEYARQNPDRLRDVLRQLAQGLLFLHGAGALHCDLKPSNVLVTAEGRVVILDFGLASQLHSPLGKSSPAGTPAYMAPEQFSEGPLTAAADWYAFGVMLYEALAGHLPWSGSIADILEAKRRSEPPQLRTRPGSEDLAALCAHLLRVEPGTRLPGADVLSQLGGDDQTVATARTPRPQWIGRTREMESLHCALRRTRDGAAIVVFVEGPPGIGKTALVRRFLNSVSAEPDVVTVSGRCYERENVPFKALDELIENLGALLRRLAPDCFTRITASDRAAVGRLFPSLVDASSRAASPVMDPHDERVRAFQVIRDVVERFCRIRLPILFIDDMHWGDADSAALLRAMLQDPTPPVLMIGTLRPESRQPEFVQTLREACLRNRTTDIVEVRLDRLPTEEACEMAAHRLGPSVAGELAQQVACQSGGNPLLIEELAASLHLEGLDAVASTMASVETLVSKRLAKTPPPIRRILEVIAVAGSPVAAEVACAAAGVTGGRSAAMAQLRLTRFVQTKASAAELTFELYHDRVRDSIAGSLAAEQAASTHLSLANALENWGRAGPDVLATQYQSGGDRSKAATYAATAGRQAMQALAFASAEKFFRMALDAGAFDGDTRGDLLHELGDALSSRGHGAEAAQAFLQAAANCLPGTALERNRRAAEQFLISGHVQQGLEAMQSVLSRLNVTMPRSALTALPRLLYWRCLLALRGLRSEPAPSGPAPVSALVRIDACWSAAQGLAVVDTIRAAALHSFHLLLALRAGDSERIARALTIEAGYHALSGGRHSQRVNDLLSRAARLARSTDEPSVPALIVLVEGIAAFLRGDWSAARNTLTRAESLLAGKCRNVAWELATTRLFSCVAMFFLGEIGPLNQRLRTLLDAAEARGDRYESTDLRIRIAHVSQLTLDRPETARQSLRQALEMWPSDRFLIQHWWALIAEIEISLYQGEGAGAWLLLRNRWRPLQLSLLMRIQYVRAETLHHRAISALAAVAAGHTGRSALIRVAEKDAARIDSEGAAWTTALATAVKAGVADARGQVGQAADLLEQASQAFEAADMHLYAAAARYRRGELLGAGGTDGAESAASWMSAQGIQRPDRVCRMLLGPRFR